MWLQAATEVFRSGSLAMLLAAWVIFPFWAGWGVTAKHEHPVREALSITMNCLVWGVFISVPLGFLVEMTTQLLSDHSGNIAKPLSFTAVIVVAGTIACRLANEGPLGDGCYSLPDSDDE